MKTVKNTFLWLIFGVSLSVRCEIIENWLGVDLRTAPEIQQMEILDFMLGKGCSEIRLDTVECKLAKNLNSPTYIWKISNGEMYVVFWGQNCRYDPGQNFIRMHLLGKNGNLIWGDRFGGGWRSSITKADLHIEDPDKWEMVKVWLNGTWYLLERNHVFFGFVGDRIAMVRLEDGEGKFQENVYKSPNATIGPLPPFDVLYDFKSVIREGKRNEVLEILTWLSGIHCSPREKQESRSMTEDMDRIILYQEIMRDPELPNILAKLSNDENRWIREAASIILNRINSNSIW